MNRWKILIFFFLITFLSNGNNHIVKFVVSKPICLFTFLETMVDNRGHSSYYKNYVRKNITSSEFYQLIEEAKEIDLNKYYFEVSDSPRNKTRYKYNKDLIKVASVNAIDLADFKERTIGLLSDEDHQKLFELLNSIEPYYDQLIWDAYKKQVYKTTKKLKKYEKQISSFFISAKEFYQSQWDENTPFKVAIYPIPKEVGVSSATPNENALICGYITDRIGEVENIVSIVIHEMCHALYDKQSIVKQWYIDSLYSTSSSKYSQSAYSYLNEGLATAIGNGWAYEKLTGFLDSNDWYYDSIISGFGKGLYPLVKDYIKRNNPIDENFIEQSIEIFKKNFPNSIYQYDILFNNIFLFSEVEEKSIMNEQLGTLMKYFNISSYNSGYPVAEIKNQKNIADKENFLFLIRANKKEALNMLKDKYQIEEEYLNKLMSNKIVTYSKVTKYGSVTIVTYQDDKELDLIFSKLKNKSVNPNKPLKVIKNE